MPTDWNSLIREIEKGRCAIFLGHGLISHPGYPDEPFYSRLCAQLAQKHHDLIDIYYPDENFFLFKDRNNRRIISNLIEDQYNALQPDMELYRMLAEIPVRLYISISPDNFLAKLLGEEGQMVFYNDPKAKSMEISATKEKPLIYNIFGFAEDSDSLLLSHDDLFGFFQHILEEQNRPTPVRYFFREDASGEVIFLGFTFNKWYMQLLLRLFNLSTIHSKNALNRAAYLNIKPIGEEELFALQHFKVKFIETQIKEFVRTLHQKCKEKGILRQLNTRQKQAETILAEHKHQSFEDIKYRLNDARELRRNYETRLLYSDDPKEIKRYQMEIDDLGKEIEKLTEQLKSLAS